MQNKNVKKSLITKLTTLFVVIVLSLGLVTSSVFATPRKFADIVKDINKRKVTLSIEDAQDVEKVLAGINLIDELKIVGLTKEDIEKVELTSNNTKIKVTPKSTSTILSSEAFELDRIEPSASANKEEEKQQNAETPFYKKWWIWTLIATVIIAIIGVSYYFIKKRQQK
ncbi:hypothetical protein J8J04_00485 ['Fragaria x ananassa' phyllody phytoplasma]|uniref:Antigenic membrane protein n=1 Tax='Fragaria x ananassa' phyllody phytoplasma TaxID=2358428 RepID=A0ABS5K2W7_9MOLU|nr:hypothetical protein ['Fragaria x ananassa' phyllody phytoplasma]MBS2126198.1 hypothetical protein ['Fragaria x ananassa' phyllody phytoplasma]